MIRGTSIVIKMWLTFTALVLLVMVPLGVALNRLMNDFYRHQVTEPLLYHSQQLAQMVEADPRNVQMAPAMGQMVGGRVTILDRTGVPLSFPGAAPDAPPAAAATAALAGSTYTGRLGDHLVTAVPIQNRGGAVILLAPAAPVLHSLTLARRLMLLAGMGTLFLGATLALLLARRLLQPVITIQEATRAIARGDFTARAAVRSGDEIGLLAQAVNTMAEQLGGYERQRREFLANVAHELRTPLSYIRGYTQAISEGLVTDPGERNRYQQIVHEEAVRLGRLVDDLMEIAEIEEGHSPLNLAPLNLAGPIEQALSIIRPWAEAKAVTLRSDVLPDLPRPFADSDRIQQVLFNLLDNALRHTDSGGHIWVSATGKGGWVMVSVCNDGHGLDPAAIPLVFERFYKHGSSGRGLGLAIVRSIVRAHGGDVGAASVPGRETTFWFTLPVGGYEARRGSAQASASLG